MGKESLHNRFVRLATKRANTVLEKIRVLSNCSNKALYEYSEEEVNKIFLAIGRELNDAKAKFQTKKSNKFSL